MGSGTELTTIEMHTGGEPVRIVTSGYPAIPGATILDKRRHARDHLDHLRRLLMFEPRGHFDMYGVIPVEPDHADADLAVLFMHNEGYSTMCGHAVIALGRWAVDTGVVPATEPETAVAIQVPAGLVRARVAVTGGRSGAVTFENVPAFVLAEATVDVAGHGTVAVTIAYGGAFYAFAPAAHFGLDVRKSPIEALTAAAAATTTAAAAQVPMHHPDSDDLAFLYGTILTDGGDGAGAPSANVCVFADRQVDRSPTGSGVTARMAIEHAAGKAGVGDVRRFAGVTGAVFTGKVARTARAGDIDAVVVEVEGTAHYTGENRFTLEADDPLPGFLLR